MLQGAVHEWPSSVSAVNYCINIKVASLTRSQPFALFFNRAPNPWVNFDQVDLQRMSPEKWAERCRRLHEIVFPSVRERVEKAKEKMVERLNKSNPIIPSNKFKVGATVFLLDPRYIKNPQTRPRFEPMWIGPYVIVERKQSGTYVVKDGTGVLVDRNIPADQMKLASIKKRGIDQEKEEFVVKSIIGHKPGVGGDRWQYHVQWKGYAEPTWVAARDFVDDAIIRNYWKNLKNNAVGAAAAAAAPTTSTSITPAIAAGHRAAAKRKASPRSTAPTRRSQRRRNQRDIGQFIAQ
jgi:hypothetical protein